MIKKWFAVVTALVLYLTLSVTAFAGNALRLVDEADLVTAEEELALSNRLNEVSEQYQVELIIVTVDGLDGLTPVGYANRFYDDNLYGMGEGRDGVLLLVSMEERDYYILTNGFGHTAVTNDEIEYIGDLVADSLGSGNYYTAFNDFIDECEYEINGEINGFPFPLGMNLLISLVVGLVVALIVTGVMRSQLKSVKRQVNATEYTKSGSMQITDSTELFLYRTVNRIKKQTTSSSGSRSGGSSRGGGGGKF